MEQVPLRRVLESVTLRDGCYVVEFPRSTAFAMYTNGGVVMAAIHRAACLYAAQDPQTALHTDVLNLALHFHRPTLPAPHETKIELRLSNVSRTITTVHFQLSQNKLCSAGYIMLANLSASGDLSNSGGWTLSPAPAPTSIRSLESDGDPNWVGYHSPIELCGPAPIDSYSNLHVATRKDAAFMTDHWITPGWFDDALPNGAVWTNELVHFVVDNGVPVFLDMLDECGEFRNHKRLVEAALQQRRARAEGRSDRLRGEGLENDSVYSYSLASLSISTEIKKPLPPEGVKWLFRRLTTTGITNNRLDNNMIITNAEGEVIATSLHVVQLIPYTGKGSRL